MVLFHSLQKGFTLLYCAVTHLPQMSWYSWTMLEVTMLWSNTSSSQEHSVPSYQGLEVSDPSNLRMWRCSLCSFHLPDLLWPPYTCQPALSSRCTRMAARGTRPSEGDSEGLSYKKCVIGGYIAKIVTFMRENINKPIQDGGDADAPLWPNWAGPAKCD